MSSPKLCIVMWYNSAIREYADINFEINKIYCSKYGHDIIRSDKKTFRYKPAQWERLPLILEYIQNYDHVMYIDSDAHFYMDAPDIMNVIKQYSEKAFLFSGDVNQKHDFELNSGVFIVKNCPKSIQILTEWAYSIDLYYKRLGYYMNDKYYLYNDQGVLQYMYSINFANIVENSVVLPYGFLQHFVPGEKFAQQPYIYHMAGSNTKQRIASSQKYWDEINV